MHWLGGEYRSYHPKLWPVSKAHLTLLHDPKSKEGGEWGKKEEEGSDSMGGGQYPTGQLCQASHGRGNTKSYMGWQGAYGGGSEVLGPAPTALGLSPSQTLSLSGWAGGLMASLGWGQAPGFLMPPLLISVVLPCCLVLPLPQPTAALGGAGCWARSPK